MLSRPENLVPAILELTEIMAKSLKIELQQFSVREPDEFANAFSAMTQRRVNAVVIIESPMLIANSRGIAVLAAKQRLPSAGFNEFAEAGGLIAYGASYPEMYRRAAYFVDKILKGTKPSELPVEQPTKFELVMNMKTAKVLSIKIPQSILVRADKVIE